MLYVAYSVIKDSPIVVCMRCAEDTMYKYNLTGAIRVITRVSDCNCGRAFNIEEPQ